ncbi:MAG: M23 family metallopeptidase [Pseudomonadota bacterium]
MMRCVFKLPGSRFALSSLAMMMAAACATAPQGQGASSKLAVCPGRVSNAPPTDGRDRIRNFSATVNVRGAIIERAPVAGACLSSGYGPRRRGGGRFHYGIDLYTKGPRPIRAGGDGVVEMVDRLRGYGRTVVIRHKRGVKTRYGHLSSYAKGLRPGRRVRRGEIIGKTGESGNATAIHLHYEIIINGKARDPLGL